jgi:hypothetical protein
MPGEGGKLKEAEESVTNFIPPLEKVDRQGGSETSHENRKEDTTKGVLQPQTSTQAIYYF